MLVFFRISELLSIRRSNIVTEDLYHKIFIEVSKTDKYREGSWVYIAKTGKFTCPYTYLIKYLEAARISSFSPNFIFRSLQYDKNLKANVLSSKPLTASRAGEILKEKLKAIGLDPSKFSNHSFRSGGATSAANLNVPDRLFKVHGRWKSDSAKDGYVQSTINSTRVFMFLCKLEFNLFNFCKSEFRFSLYLSIIYTSVSCILWRLGGRIIALSTYSSYTINSLLCICLCGFHH